MDDRIKVIDDFLPPDMFVDFASMAMKAHMYSPCDFTAELSERDGCINAFGEVPMGHAPKHECMFGALLLQKDVSSYSYSDFYRMNYDTIEKITELLDVKKWWQMRINVTTGQNANFVGAYHVDSDTVLFDKQGKTACFYLNTNNGGTRFECKDTGLEGDIVRSKANRIVIFPCDMPHAGVWCTDAKLRYVMNMNYE
tara:strand:- start:1413 stop:2003 length:591 start_codon:yes stop_codon:yes gene_type:complete